MRDRKKQMQIISRLTPSSPPVTFASRSSSVSEARSPKTCGLCVLAVLQEAALESEEPPSLQSCCISFAAAKNPKDRRQYF